MQEQIMSWMGMLGWGDLATFGPALFQIIMIDIVLAGDNAVVIALACRSLPPEKRKIGIMLGALVAVLMRVVFTIGVSSLMGTPWLKVVGSLLLFWIAIKLLVEESDEHSIKESTSVLGAVQTIAIADLVMSLDNVLAIAAAAKGNWPLIIIGLAVSIPLVVFGAQLVMALLTRFPVLVWVGAGLLGWIAGELIVVDIGMAPLVDQVTAATGIAKPALAKIAAALGAVFVVGLALFLRRNREETA